MTNNNRREPGRKKMKRKVKAWVVYEVGQGQNMTFWSIENSRSAARDEVWSTVNWHGNERGDFAYAPCLVTFNDATPSRPKRKVKS